MGGGGEPRPEARRYASIPDPVPPTVGDQSHLRSYIGRGGLRLKPRAQSWAEPDPDFGPLGPWRISLTVV
ncbi:MAG: hypothetical protein QOI44_2535 [Actinomycetota bacterium]|nr:hypothetical protein [Actinomycetota bacterium]